MRISKIRISFINNWRDLYYGKKEFNFIYIGFKIVNYSGHGYSENCIYFVISILGFGIEFEKNK